MLSCVRAAAVAPQTLSLTFILARWLVRNLQQRATLTVTNPEARRRAVSCRSPPGRTFEQTDALHHLAGQTPGKAAWLIPQPPPHRKSSV